MSEQFIPRLFLPDYTQGNAEQKKQFSQQLGKAFNETGFITIANHGIDQKLIDDLYSEIQSFFALDEHIKKKYEIPGIFGQRGYTSKEKEKAKNANTPDLKEFWQCGQTVTDGDPVKDMYPENILITESLFFNNVMIDIYAQLEYMGRQLLMAIAEYLSLPVNYFEEYVHNGNSILRALHYFPIENPDALPEDAVRSSAHEDINLITLLIGASADGLQVLKRDGTWFAVQAQGEDIVVNVGDMLQTLTNNVLQSTTHRVVNPPRELMGTSRFSVPFFLHPKSSMSLACIDSCISSENPKAYKDITAGEYLDQRLREIGLKM
jgi:isopenicillin N synthase-like dioxygenase